VDSPPDTSKVTKRQYVSGDAKSVADFEKSVRSRNIDTIFPGGGYTVEKAKRGKKEKK
jgi:hypothetical protein